MVCLYMHNKQKGIGGTPTKMGKFLKPQMHLSHTYRWLFFAPSSCLLGIQVPTRCHRIESHMHMSHAFLFSSTLKVQHFAPEFTPHFLRFNSDYFVSPFCRHPLFYIE
ncbi:hypothetical protein V6Z11_A11G111500 [Gossypium hirsutum]